MKKRPYYISIYLIICGTMTLALTRVTTLSGNNALLIAGLLLNVCGIVSYIYGVKHNG